MNPKILLAEDDVSLGFVIQDNLTRHGYDVQLCTNGEEAEHLFQQQKIDICVLDVMLPKKDGFALARAIRKTDQHVPILFVTAKEMLEDKIAGFQSGGDDYIIKPFSMEELVLRIEVFLRRNGTHQELSSFPLGDFSFDFQNLTLRHPGGNKTLTQKEAEVLRLLCLHRDRILKREEILKLVWGNDDYFMGRSMDVFISKLRKYLKDDSRVQIVNFHGVGFKLEFQATS